MSRYMIVDMTPGRVKRVESHHSLESASVAYWSLNAHEYLRRKNGATGEPHRYVIFDTTVAVEDKPSSLSELDAIAQAIHVMPLYDTIRHRLQSYVLEVYDAKDRTGDVER